MNTPDRSIIKLLNISKNFPGVKALNNINLEIYSGEIFGIVGENGAGKSTLVKILAGVLKPTSGKIFVDGNETVINSPSEALSKGLSFIFQERNLCPFLSVQENVFAGRLPFLPNHLVDWKTLEAETKKILSLLKTNISPRAIVGRLSVADQQIIEIARALSFKSRVLIMDEPTASLSSNETSTLFGIIRELKKQGVTIIFISHRLREILEITDRVGILRDGKLVGIFNTFQIDENSLIKMMVGRDIKDAFGLPKIPPREKIVLSVIKVSVTGSLKNVSFDLQEGEILGIAGLVGSKRTQILRSIFGLENLVSGEIIIEKDKIHHFSPLRAIHRGISYLPENRKEEGLFPFLSITKNITITTLDRFTHYGFLDKKEEKRESKHLINKLNIKTANLDSLVFSLSGGNQQKTIIARGLLSKPKIFLLDEPTQGIDVGSKFEIYKIIRELANEGMSIIFVSSEIPELLGICHRIIVMCQGNITGILKAEEADQEKIMYLATRFS